MNKKEEKIAFVLGKKGENYEKHKILTLMLKQSLLFLL